MKKKVSGDACPCGNHRSFVDCCGRYLDLGESPPTAEALMRSRYSAYALRREAYLLATWHPSTRPASLDLQEGLQPRWIGLEVRRHEQQDAEHASVEFIARYKQNGRAYRLCEISRFVRTAGRWYYVDGASC